MIYGPLNSGKSILIKGLCRKFLKNFEKTQIMWIPSIENFTGIGLNKKIDDFQLHHFNSDKLTKIIVQYLTSGFGAITSEQRWVGSN